MRRSPIPGAKVISVTTKFGRSNGLRSFWTTENPPFIPTPIIPYNDHDPGDGQPQIAENLEEGR
jgi:hypothetical protein